MSAVFRILVSLVAAEATRQDGLQLLQRAVSRRENQSGKPLTDFICRQSHSISFENVEITNNNLGGMGPRKDQPEGVRWAGIIGPKIDLEAHVTGGILGNKYQPKNSKRNGKSDSKHFGRINLMTGSEVNVTFRLVQKGTKKLVSHLPPYLFSFLDLDEGWSHASKEVAIVTPACAEVYVRTSNSELRVVETKRSSTFMSTKRGGKADNPVHPRHLSRAQERRAASCQFPPKTPEFTVTFVEANYAKAQGRNFLLAGPTSLTCGSVGPCEDFDCPKGKKPKKNAAMLFCKENPCSQNSGDLVCCEATKKR